MYRKDFEDELTVKKEMGIKDFSLLSCQGVLGNYLECELTHIFLLERKTQRLHHYYALCSYEEFQENDETKKDIFLTKKLVKINENYCLGIIQMRLSLDESKIIFNQLCQKQFHFRDKTVFLPDTFQLLPKTHIPSMFENEGITINKILKPNFWGDRYILEFISIETPFRDFSVSDFEKINTEISNYISVNLSSVNDRIGSFIFQFPITLISVDRGISKDWCKARLSMKIHSKLIHQNDMFTIVKTKLDNTITGFNSFNRTFENLELDLGDSNNLELIVFNTTNAIVYHHSLVNFLRDVNIGGGIFKQNAEPRIITHRDGSKTGIHLTDYGLNVSTGRRNYYDSRINKRVFNNDVINHSGEFQNFYPGEEDKALEFIRVRIKRYEGSSSEIWLWDPFLRYQDIMETLYYTEVIDMPMKCITSFRKIKSYKEEDKNYLSFVESERSKIMADKNLGINLEFRVVHDNIGFSFHDRFLFFIPKDEESIPIVYSLGTSVNGLGKSHHLIMQAVYPRFIVDAFHELWQILGKYEDSLIIKLPEGK